MSPAPLAIASQQAYLHAPHGTNEHMIKLIVCCSFGLSAIGLANVPEFDISYLNRLYELLAAAFAHDC